MNNSREILQEARYSVPNRVVIQDCLFLSIVVLLSVILYVQKLGFYSDDWAFLAAFNTSTDQSLAGLFLRLYNSSTGGHVLIRPVQGLYLAGLYYLFGLHPLGYHLVNAAVLLSGIVLFYLVLHELSQRRVLALAVPVVYALLPHYSTDRFWFAAFQANLSMVLYFLSLYADLRILRARQARLWGWKLLSIFSLLGSTLAYEVFLPLFFLNSLLVWYRRRKLYGSVPGRHLNRAQFALLFGSNLLALMLVIVFKALTKNSVGNFSLTGHIVSFVKLVAKAMIVSYGDYGLGLFRVVYRLLHYYPNWEVSAVGGVLGLIIFGYLYRVASQSKAGLLSQMQYARFIVWGLAVFGLGYMIFLALDGPITPTGKGNRVAIAGTVGVAISLVGGIGWVTTLLPSDRLRRRCFCVLIAILCTSGFLINNTLASFWITSYHQEQEVLDGIHQQLPTLSTGSTLILDGVCPYVGPAVVFESSWDLAGALIMFYRDNTLRADVVTPNLKVNEDGLSTSLYGEKFNYGYEKLFVYHHGRRMTHQLTDAETARLYFQTFNPDYGSGCPEGDEEHGVAVFSSFLR